MNFMAKIRIIKNPNQNWTYWVRPVISVGSSYKLRFGYIAGPEGATGNFLMINGNPITLELTDTNGDASRVSIIHPPVMQVGMNCSMSTTSTSIPPGDYYIYLHGVFSDSKHDN